MKNTIQCKYYNQKLTQLDTPPYHGDLGQKIYLSISEKAWNQWLEQQTKLINEYHLSTIDPEAIQFLENQMITFLFDKKSVNPPEFTPKESKE
jgi:Fe-S cluster biosynthesis and repair protein YggX